MCKSLSHLRNLNWYFDLCEWHVVMFGPKRTCFEGGSFNLRLYFPPDYPSRAPNAYFFSRMFHPNVHPDGRVCILKLEKDWNPSFDASSILNDIQTMLGDPNTDSPANLEASRLYKDHTLEYRLRVRKLVRESDREETISNHRNINADACTKLINERVASLDLSDHNESPELLRRFLSSIWIIYHLLLFKCMSK